MHIRPPFPAERDALLDIWLRSVRATHHFLPPEHVEVLHPMVRDLLQGDALELWALADDADRLMGWMGLAGNKIEALFLAPEHFGKGGGRRLVEYAAVLNGELSLDVNEQNEGARRFYEACGFVVEGRSPLDGQGNPFPLLHMRREG